MKFALKSLKVHKDLSEETQCYSATLLIDDRPAFACSNRGHGGCDDIRPIGTHKIADVETYLRNNTPAGVTLYEFSSPIECLVSRLIEVEDASKLLKSRLRTSFVFIENDEVHLVKPARGRKFDETWANAIAEKYPERRRVTQAENWEAAIDILTKPIELETAK